MESEEEFIQLMESSEYGYRLVRKIGTEYCGLTRMMFTIGLVVGLDKYGYKYRYCYSTMGEAILAIETWNGEGDAPGNWIVRKGKGGDFPNPNRVG